jgi:hypothetical protein
MTKEPHRNTAAAAMPLPPPEIVTIAANREYSREDQKGQRVRQASHEIGRADR